MDFSVFTSWVAAILFSVTRNSRFKLQVFSLANFVFAQIYAGNLNIIWRRRILFSCWLKPEVLLGYL